MPIGVVAGRYWILRKGVEDVGEDELLMLLLVMEADLEDAHHLGQLRIVDAGEQALYSRVDMGAKRGDALAVRLRDEPALGPRMARPSRHIVRVEEIGEALIEDAIAGEMRQQEKLLEEPGRMRAVPLGRAGIGHRLHHLILGAQGRGAALRFRAHRAKRITPSGPRIGRRGSWDCCGITFVMAATKDG